jgi:hypothetical protein
MFQTLGWLSLCTTIVAQDSRKRGKKLLQSGLAWAAVHWSPISVTVQNGPKLWISTSQQFQIVTVHYALALCQSQCFNQLHRLSAIVSPPNLLSDYYMTRFAWLSPTLLFCRASPFAPTIWALVSGYHWCWWFLCIGHQLLSICISKKCLRVTNVLGYNLGITHLLCISILHSDWEPPNIHPLCKGLVFLNREERPVSEHLSTQGRPDTRGGLHCFWCPQKIEPLVLVCLTH